MATVRYACPPWYECRCPNGTLVCRSTMLHHRRRANKIRESLGRGAFAWGPSVSDPALTEYRFTRYDSLGEHDTGDERDERARSLSNRTGRNNVGNEPRLGFGTSPSTGQMELSRQTNDLNVRILMNEQSQNVLGMHTNNIFPRTNNEEMRLETDSPRFDRCPTLMANFSDQNEPDIANQPRHPIYTTHSGSCDEHGERINIVVSRA